MNAQAMEKSSADSGIGADDSDDDAVVTELIENTDDLAAEGIKVNNGKGHHLVCLPDGCATGLTWLWTSR